MVETSASVWSCTVRIEAKRTRKFDYIESAPRRKRKKLSFHTPWRNQFQIDVWNQLHLSKTGQEFENWLVWSVWNFQPAHVERNNAIKGRKNWNVSQSTQRTFSLFDSVQAMVNWTSPYIVITQVSCDFTITIHYDQRMDVPFTI